MARATATAAMEVIITARSAGRVGRRMYEIYTPERSGEKKALPKRPRPLDWLSAQTR